MPTHNVPIEPIRSAALIPTLKAPTTAPRTASARPKSTSQVIFITGRIPPITETGEGGFWKKGGAFGDKGRGKSKTGTVKGMKCEEQRWVPVTELGRLPKDGKIGSHLPPLLAHEGVPELTVDPMAPAKLHEGPRLRPLEPPTRPRSYQLE